MSTTHKASNSQCVFENMYGCQDFLPHIFRANIEMPFRTSSRESYLLERSELLLPSPLVSNVVNSYLLCVLQVNWWIYHPDHPVLRPRELGYQILSFFFGPRTPAKYGLHIIGFKPKWSRLIRIVNTSNAMYVFHYIFVTLTIVPSNDKLHVISNFFTRIWSGTEYMQTFFAFPPAKIHFPSAV